MSRFDNRVYVVEKAIGPTSFDVVAAMRRAVKLRKVGHAGTLDPAASGILLLCTGTATRAVEHFMDLEKEYRFSVRLGVETTTLDTEGDVVRDVPCPDFARSDIDAAAASFVGDYELTPPRYSAIKRDGRRMYELARDGEEPDVPTRTVRIYGMDVADVSLPEIECVVRCSRGTYVRSLARDLGERLGVPAHVTRLARTRVGPFGLDIAYPSGRIADRDVDDLEGIDLSGALDFLPGVVLSASSRKALFYGSLPGNQDVVRTVGNIGGGQPVRLLGEDGTLLAVGRRREGAAHNRLHVVDSFRLYVERSAV